MTKTKINKNKKRFRKKTRRLSKKMNGGNDDEMKLIYTKRGQRMSPWGGFVVGEVYLNNQGHIKIIISQEESRNILHNPEVVYLDDKTFGPISNDLIDLYKNVMDSTIHEIYTSESRREMGKELGSISLFKKLSSNYNVINDTEKKNEDVIKGLNQRIMKLSQDNSEKKYEHVIKGLNQRIMKLVQDNSELNSKNLILKDEIDMLKTTYKSSDNLLPNYDQPVEFQINSPADNSKQFRVNP